MGGTRRWAFVLLVGSALVAVALSRYMSASPSPPVASIAAVIPVGSQPAAALSVDQGGVWVANDGEGTISRIDPNTDQVVATIRVGTPSCDRCLGTVTQLDGTVWATSTSARLTLMRIDPTTNQVAATSEVPIFPSAMLSASDGSLWLASMLDGEVVRLDPQTGRALAVLTVPGVHAMAEGGGALWVTARTGRTDGHLTRIDLSSNQIVGDTSLPIQPGAVAYADHDVWVVDEASDAVVRVDPTTNSIMDRLHIGYAPTGLVVADGRLWVVSAATSAIAGPALTWIDPREASIGGRLALGHGSPVGLAAGAQGLWVVSRDPDVVTHIALPPAAGDGDGSVAVLAMVVAIALLVAVGAAYAARPRAPTTPVVRGALLAELRVFSARRTSAAFEATPPIDHRSAG